MTFWGIGESTLHPRLYEMIGMAKQLGYRVIAEGVESREHVEFLLQEGCHEVQGFLIGKPVAEDELEFVLRDSALPTAMAISA